MLKPLLTVVVPVYNGEKFIVGCLSSVRESVADLSAEDRGAVRVIICDNHSTDRTRELAEQAGVGCALEIIQPSEHYENRTKNWHHGLSAATTEWMMMLHADDMLAPQGLGALLRACRRQAEGSAVLISGRHRTFKENDGPRSGLEPTWSVPALISGEAIRRRVFPFLCPLVPFTVIRRATYEQVGGLDTRYELVQDWDLWIRMLAHGDLCYCSEEIGQWRLHGFSPQYAMTFAREHLLLGAQLQKLIPRVSEREATEALDMQMACAQRLMPDSSPQQLVAGTEAEESVRRRPQPTLPSAESTMKRYYQRVRMQLVWLRLLGSLRGLTAR